MFDRLSISARKVLSLARQEAVRLGHPQICTEHVLVAIGREIGGVGCEVLEGELKLPYTELRKEVEKKIPATSDEVMLSLERDLSPKVRLALDHARDEATADGDAEVDSGHLLSSFERDPEALATRILMEKSPALHEGTALRDLAIRVRRRRLTATASNVPAPMPTARVED